MRKTGESSQENVPSVPGFGFGFRRLDQKGEKETANLKAKIGRLAEIARDLANRLYTLCERKGWADEAGYYNSLVVAWPSMASEAFELSGS